MTLPRALLLSLAVSAALRAADAPPNGVTDISSDQGEATTVGDETTTVLTGHVIVVSADLRITADYLKMISTSAGAKAPARSDVSGEHYKYFLATGRVHFVQGDVEATCGRAEILPDKDMTTLTGDPVVTDRGHGQTLRGEPIVITGHGKNYRVSVTHSHATGASPLRDIVPEGPPAPAKPAPPKP